MAESNLMKLKVNEMVDMFVPLVRGSRHGRDLPAINLSGAPGVGKSDGVRCIAARLEEETGKKVFVHDVRLLNMNPVDLRGIPSKDNMKANIEVNGKIEEATVAVARWLRPAIFQMDPSPDVINILFLDEITAAPQSVQAAAYQLVLDRKVGEHRLPDNCFVFCAGNRVSDKSVAYRMPKALANRMCHIEIYSDVSDWRKWAIDNDIDSRILGFVSYKPDTLFKFDPSNEDLAYPTPRSWAMVDSFLKKIPDIGACYALVAGCIGVGMATEFQAYASVYQDLPDVKKIFNGEKVEYPTQPDVGYALSASIVSHASKANKKQIDNLLVWLDKWSAKDLSTCTIRDLVGSKKLTAMISSSPAWVEWVKHNRKFVAH